MSAQTDRLAAARAAARRDAVANEEALLDMARAQQDDQ